MLDIRTVLFEGALIGIAVAVVMIYYSMVRKTYPGFHHWTVGFTLAGIGSFLIAFRGIIPDFISIVLANIFIVSTPFMLSLGLSHLSGIKWRFRNHYSALLLLYIILISYTTYVYPSVHIRIVLFNSMFILLFLESLRITIRCLPRRLGSQNYLLIIAIMGIILPAALRLRLAIIKGDNIFFLENTDSVQCILILSSIVFTVLTMISLIILNAHLIEIELREANKKVEFLANTDELTGMFNRRYFNKALQYEHKRLKRSSQPLSLIMADIDYFKEYNDTYGHQVGDECIKRVATIFKHAATRVSDIAAVRRRGISSPPAEHGRRRRRQGRGHPVRTAARDGHSAFGIPGRGICDHKRRGGHRHPRWENHRGPHHQHGRQGLVCQQAAREKPVHPLLVGSMPHTAHPRSVMRGAVS